MLVVIGFIPGGMLGWYFAGKLLKSSKQWDRNGN